MAPVDVDWLHFDGIVTWHPSVAAPSNPHQWLQIWAGSCESGGFPAILVFVCSPHMIRVGEIDSSCACFHRDDPRKCECARQRRYHQGIPPVLDQRRFGKGCGHQQPYCMQMSSRYRRESRTEVTMDPSPAAKQHVDAPIAQNGYPSMIIVNQILALVPIMT